MWRPECPQCLKFACAHYKTPGKSQITTPRLLQIRPSSRNTARAGWKTSSAKLDGLSWQAACLAFLFMLTEQTSGLQVCSCLLIHTALMRISCVLVECHEHKLLACSVLFERPLQRRGSFSSPGNASNEGPDVFKRHQIMYCDSGSDWAPCLREAIRPNCRRDVVVWGLPCAHARSCYAISKQRLWLKGPRGALQWPLAAP